MSSCSASRLNRATLNTLPASVSGPGYPVEKVTTGIVHIGVGGFHRAHQAMYIDTLMREQAAYQWGICGVGLREGDRKMQQILAEQDYLFGLTEKHPDNARRHQIIGCMTDFLMATDDPAAVINKLATPEVKLVSLTITEGGYNLDPNTGEFVADNPDVQHDLANPQQPKLVFGYLLAALKQRRDAGIAPFTLMSCDNIQHNGDVLKAMLLAYATLSDQALAQWIEQHVSFPNSMVDRITPATVAADIDELAQAGVEDQWPVVCEPFHQWVIEDAFCNERPDFEAAGAQLVPDVAPYEKLKLRMLNASHSVLGLLGSLAGISTIDACMNEPVLRQVLKQFMLDDVKPTLDAVEGVNVDEYAATLLERFGNPNIKDSLERICSQSSAKIPVFLLPTIQDNLKAGRSVALPALVIAAWCYYSDKQTTQAGQALTIIDDMAAELHTYAGQTEQDSLAFLQLKTVFANLSQSTAFTEQYTGYLTRLYAGEPVLDIVTAL